MTGYRLSQQAARDYREILAFTLSKWGVAQFESRKLSASAENERYVS